MKVIGRGSPEKVRVRFEACELEVLVDVLRDLRASATRDAADTYTITSVQGTRAIDARHTRLRELEGLLIQLEERPPGTESGATLVGATALVRDVARHGASEAIQRLNDVHEYYEDHVTRGSREALLAAAKTAKAWVATLTAVERVDLGWER
jgi:hypothetical protein